MGQALPSGKVPLQRLCLGAQSSAPQSCRHRSPTHTPTSLNCSLCASEPRPLHRSLYPHMYLSDPCTSVCPRGSPTHTSTSLNSSLLFRKTSRRHCLTWLPRGPAKWTWSAPGTHGLHRASGRNDRLHAYGFHAGRLSAPSSMWASLSVGSRPSSRPAPAQRSAQGWHSASV